MASTMRVIGLAVLVALWVGQPPPAAAAAPPLAAVHTRLDRIMALLRQPGLTRGQRRAAVLAEAEPAFDWDAMARTVLGPSWHDRTPAERATFTRLFRSLVEEAYLSRVLHYRGERLVYGREVVNGDAALLRTEVVRSAHPPISVDYELARRGDRWLVEDVLVEHVSLVENYQSQVAAILSRSSYPQLIATLRARIASLA
jgi:phospholipid transport system substrate-binding protein